MTNDFETDLQWSHSLSDEPWWEAVYREAFVDFAGMRSVKQDGWAQRAGIDRQVFLTGGKILQIDEKARRSDWPDIILEYYSNEQQEKPGWIAKSLGIDYLAYAFVPSRRCYLLPFPTLRRAWKLNRREWYAHALVCENGFRVVRAKNRGYVTVSLAVPIPVLLQAVSDTMLVNWLDGAA